MPDQPHAGQGECVVDLLHRTRYQRGVLVLLSDDGTRISFDGPAGQVVPGDVRDAILAREAEVRGHLLASPGIHIAGYPRDLAIESHGFQEIRIAERRKRHKVVEAVVGGVTVTKWFDDPPGWRLREIARELCIEHALGKGARMKRRPRSTRHRHAPTDGHDTTRFRKGFERFEQLGGTDG